MKARCKRVSPRPLSFSLRMVSGTCFLLVAPWVVRRVSEPRDPSACAENLTRSSRSLAGPALSTACFSASVCPGGVQAHLGPPETPSASPPLALVSTCEGGRQAGRWVREVLRGPLCSGITGWTRWALSWRREPGGSSRGAGAPLPGNPGALKKKNSLPVSESKLQLFP